MGLKSDVFVLRASAVAAVGAGNGTLVVDAAGFEVGAVFIDATAKTGTFTSWLFALQVSMDGTNFSGIGTQAAPLAAAGSIAAATDLATGRYWFPMNNFAGPYVRLAWVTAGGTDVTFSASMALRQRGGRR